MADYSDPVPDRVVPRTPVVARELSMEAEAGRLAASQARIPERELDRDGRPLTVDGRTIEDHVANKLQEMHGNVQAVVADHDAKLEVLRVHIEALEGLAGMLNSRFVQLERTAGLSPPPSTWVKPSWNERPHSFGPARSWGPPKYYT